MKEESEVEAELSRPPRRIRDWGVIKDDRALVFRDTEAFCSEDQSHKHASGVWLTPISTRLMIRVVLDSVGFEL